MLNIKIYRKKRFYNYIAELIIKEILEKTDTLPALVYRVYLYADYPQNTEVGFIDAHTGSLRMTEPVLIDFSAQGTFATRYSGSQQGTTHNYQGSYHLVDSTRNTIIHTWNLEGRTNILSRVDKRIMITIGHRQNTVPTTTIWAWTCSGHYSVFATDYTILTI